MTPSLAFASAGWTPLVALDVASAAVGCALALLCLVGFVPLVRLQGTPAQRRIVLMLVAFFLIALTRMAWWDLLRPLEALVGLTGPLQRSARAALINLGFNVAACGALLLGLSALHVSIPPEDRGPYGWLTAPWYPPGSRPFVRLFLGARSQGGMR